jgi:hypothetical protein
VRLGSLHWAIAREVTGLSQCPGCRLCLVVGGGTAGARLGPARQPPICKHFVIDSRLPASARPPHLCPWSVSHSCPGLRLARATALRKQQGATFASWTPRTAGIEECSPPASGLFVGLPLLVPRLGVGSCLLCLGVGDRVGLPLAWSWSAVRSAKSAYRGSAPSSSSCPHGLHLLHGGDLCGGNTCEPH